METPSQNRPLSLWAVFALLLAAVGTFAPVVTFDFIHQYDDQFYLLENPLLHQPSVDGFVSLFTTFQTTDYLPVLYTSFLLDTLLWGRNAAGFHLTNLLIHSANGILVYLLILGLTGRRLAAFFTALVFLIHPVQVETVAWIPERKNVLVLFFLLATFHFIWFKNRPWLGVFFFVLALLSKSLAVVFPGLFFLAPGTVRKKVGMLPLVVMASLGLAVAILTLASQGSVGAVKPYHGGSPFATAVLMGQTYWDYLWALLTGRGLFPFYAVPPMDLLSGLGFFVFLAAGLSYLSYKKDWFMVRSAGAFFLFLLPVSNLVPIAVLRSDRYLYIPIIAFFLALFTFLQRAAHKAGIRNGQPGVWLAGIALCAYYIPVTIQHLPVYKNAHTLWSRVAEDPKLQGIASYNLGVVCEKDGQIAPAMACYERARRMTGHCMATNNLGALLFQQGNKDEAHRLFQEATQRCPSHPGPMFNLGMSYLVRQDTAKARTCLVDVAGKDGFPELAERAREALQHMNASEPARPFRFAHPSDP